MHVGKATPTRESILPAGSIRESIKLRNTRDGTSATRCSCGITSMESGALQKIFPAGSKDARSSSLTFADPTPTGISAAAFLASQQQAREARSPSFVDAIPSLANTPLTNTSFKRGPAPGARRTSEQRLSVSGGTMAFAFNEQKQRIDNLASCIQSVSQDLADQRQMTAKVLEQLGVMTPSVPSNSRNSRDGRADSTPNALGFKLGFSA